MSEFIEFRDVRKVYKMGEVEISGAGRGQFPD